MAAKKKLDNVKSVFSQLDCSSWSEVLKLSVYYVAETPQKVEVTSKESL